MYKQGRGKEFFKFARIAVISAFEFTNIETGVAKLIQRENVHFSDTYQEMPSYKYTNSALHD